ncbi:hypothetical protein BV898_17047 [Hypsibius exemplaris]|uniref:Uncharacterized protein n=1 Tax=Hypsibius exemplaris TaxID=2072580 RepID=A0A9X6NH07_HYPEX|nr:hypothetical protein BV898_17047 [Hypsibius exemplaris]
MVAELTSLATLSALHLFHEIETTFLSRATLKRLYQASFYYVPAYLNCPGFVALNRTTDTFYLMANTSATFQDLCLIHPQCTQAMFTSDNSPRASSTGSAGFSCLPTQPAATVLVCHRQGICSPLWVMPSV